MSHPLAHASSSSSSSSLDSSFGRRLLSDLLARRSYAATLPNGRKETHDQNVDRVVAMHVKRFPKLADPIEEAFGFVRRKEVLPSMRLMQFSGQAVERSNARAYNCSATTIESFQDFADIFWLSMNGCGVGYSVQRRHTGRLPEIVAGTREQLFVVQDTKESWADSIVVLLSNPQCRFDYSLIRAENTPLSTGGTASGPKPLRDAHERVRKILKGAVGRKLRPIEVHDIACHQSDAVVVGGVRRAALIALFDHDDGEMLACKSGNWRTENPQRERANNSAVVVRGDHDVDHLMQIMDSCFASYDGEPGFFVTNDPDYLTNPCQPADAPLLTPDGVRTMGEISVGDTIWSGQQWTKVTQKVCTGVKPVYEYRTTAGTFIGTENHRVVQNGVKVEVKDADAIDVSKGPSDHKFSVNDLNSADVMDGLVFGDGYVHKASNNTVFLCVGENDGSLLDMLKDEFIERSGVGPFAWKVRTSMTHLELPRTFDRSVPVRFKQADPAKMAGFLRGLFSANGSVVSGRITLKTSSLAVADDVQGMLSSLGIVSYRTTNKEHRTVFSNGEYTCKKSYDVNITTDRKTFQRLIGFVHPYKNEKLSAFIADARETRRQKTTYDIIETTFRGEETVWDITVEADEHTYWTNGLLVSNCGEIALRNKQTCNLSEVNVAACLTANDLYAAAKAASFIGTLQATLTDFPYIQPAWKRNCDEEALLGVSLTGQAENWPLLSSAYILRNAAQIVLDENERAARLLGINVAARCGTTKPSGSASIYLGTTSGVHGAFSPRYVRRVQLEKNNPLAQHMIEIYGLGEPGEGRAVEQHHNKSGSVQVAAPIAAPKAIIASQESAVDLMNRALHIKRNWIEPSHRSGPNTHNVSMTVYYGPDEQNQIKDWLTQHHGSLSGIAFLPRDGGGYKALQMPYEEISEDAFTSRLKEYEGKRLSFDDVDFSKQADERLGEAACKGGACDVI